MQLYVNRNFFIKFIENKPILWDYKAHKQYVLEKKYLDRIFEVFESNGNPIVASDVDADLLESGVFTELDTETNQDVWGWDTLSHIFHFGTRDIPQDQSLTDRELWASSYIEYCESILAKGIPEFSDKHEDSYSIELPKANLDKLKDESLWSALLSRKTCRTFLSQNVSLEKVSTILYSSFAFIESRFENTVLGTPELLRFRRTSPSLGGLNATDIYVVSLRVADLKQGVYQYNSKNHSLRLIQDIDVSENFGEILFGQNFANDLSFGVFITGRLDKLWWKYGHSRAYRASYMEAGHLSQSFQLSSTALGLQTWLTGSFNDSGVDRLLNLDSTKTYPILFVGAGVSNGDSLDVELRKIIADASSKA